jgi:alanine transaminase
LNRCFHFSKPTSTTNTVTPNMTAASATMPKSVLTLTNINPNLVKAEYAVRGEIAVRAEQHRQQLAAKDADLPFDSVISANIGNPQQLDQKPITFFRQVLSILEYPALLKTEGIFPNDVKVRAEKLLAGVGSVGAYSQSQGALNIRQSVAAFIESMFEIIIFLDPTFLPHNSASPHTRIPVDQSLGVLCSC